MTCQSVLQHWLSEEEVARVMKRYDTDGSGDLAADEFQHLVRQAGLRLRDWCTAAPCLQGLIMPGSDREMVSP